MLIGLARGRNHTQSLSAYICHVRSTSLVTNSWTRAFGSSQRCLGPILSWAEAFGDVSPIVILLQPLLFLLCSVLLKCARSLSHALRSPLKLTNCWVSFALSDFSREEAEVRHRLCTTADERMNVDKRLTLLKPFTVKQTQGSLLWPWCS